LEIKDYWHTELCMLQRNQDAPLPALYLSRKMTSQEGGWDIGSEGTQEISPVTHSLPPTATTKKFFCFFFTNNSKMENKKKKLFLAHRSYKTRQEPRFGLQAIVCGPLL